MYRVNNNDTWGYGMVSNRVKKMNLDSRLLSLMFTDKTQPKLSVEIKKLLTSPLKLLLLREVVYEHGSYIKE